MSAPIIELAGIPAPTFAEEPRICWLEARQAEATGRGDGTRPRIRSVVERRSPPGALVLAHADTAFPAEMLLCFEPHPNRGAPDPR